MSKRTLYEQYIYRRSGMPDTIGTEAIVGGYFNSIVFLGEFLGPVIGGCLIDKYNNIVTWIMVESPYIN